MRPLPVSQIILAATILLAVTTARSDPPSPEPAVALDGRPLTLADAVDLARRNNHDLAAARNHLVAAKSGVEVALGALLPTASGVGIYTHNYKNVTYANLFATRDIPPGEASAFASLGNVTVLKGDALQGTLNVAVPLLAPPAYSTLAAAKETFLAAEANFRVSEADLLFVAAQTFFAAAGADELLQARRHAIEVAQATLRTAQARFSAGTVNRTEVTRAQLALMSATQARREADATREQAYRSLGTILGQREEFQVVPIPPVDGAEVATPSSLPALAEQAAGLRPEFAAYHATASAAASQARAAAWQWSPTLAGFGALNGYNYAGITGDKYAWDVGVQLNWTIYDGGIRDAARRQAEATRAESEEHLAQLHATVTDDIANATRSKETKRMALENARESVSLATDTLNMFRAQYQGGTAMQLDVLQAQDALVSAEVQVVQARFDLALASLALDRSVGTFPGKRVEP